MARCLIGQNVYPLRPWISLRYRTGASLRDGRSRPHIKAMHLDLSDEEAA
jgi:hypothetical protein